MKKVNIKELTQKLNEFISKKENKNRTFTGAELHEALLNLGFSNGICYKITSKFFPFEQVGKGRLYEIPDKPIYIGLVEGLYKSQAKNSMKSYNKRKEASKNAVTELDKFHEAKEVNDAIRLLLSKGYKISRPLGLDVKQLLADHPELAKQYMRYDTI